MKIFLNYVSRYQVHAVQKTTVLMWVKVHNNFCEKMPNASRKHWNTKLGVCMRNCLMVNNQNNKMLYLHYVYCSSMMRAIFSCLSTTKNFLMQYILTSMTQPGQGCLLLVDLYQLDSGETMQDYGDNLCSGLTCRNSFSLFFCYRT